MAAAPAAPAPHNLQEGGKPDCTPGSQPPNRVSAADPAPCSEHLPGSCPQSSSLSFPKALQSQVSAPRAALCHTGVLSTATAPQFTGCTQSSRGPEVTEHHRGCGCSPQISQAMCQEVQAVPLHFCCCCQVGKCQDLPGRNFHLSDNSYFASSTQKPGPA